MVISSVPEPLYLQPPGLSQGHLLGLLLHLSAAFARQEMTALSSVVFSLMPPSHNGKGVNCGDWRGQGRDQEHYKRIQQKEEEVEEIWSETME